MMKTFNFNGDYVPASAIVTLKPPPKHASAYSQKWTVHLASGRFFELDVSDSGHHNIRNQTVAQELREYFGIPDTVAGSEKKSPEK